MLSRPLSSPRVIATKPIVYLSSTSENTHSFRFNNIVTSMLPASPNTAFRKSCDPLACNALLGNTTPILPRSSAVSRQNLQQNALYTSASPVPMPGKSPPSNALRTSSFSLISASNAASKSGRSRRNSAFSASCSRCDMPRNPGKCRAQKPCSSTFGFFHGGLPRITSKPDRSRKKTSGNATGKCNTARLDSSSAASAASGADFKSSTRRSQFWKLKSLTSSRLEMGRAATRSHNALADATASLASLCASRA